MHLKDRRSLSSSMCLIQQILSLVLEHLTESKWVFRFIQSYQPFCDFSAGLAAQARSRLRCYANFASIVVQSWLGAISLLHNWRAHGSISVCHFFFSNNFDIRERYIFFLYERSVSPFTEIIFSVQRNNIRCLLSLLLHLFS